MYYSRIDDAVAEPGRPGARAADAGQRGGQVLERDGVALEEHVERRVARQLQGEIHPPRIIPARPLRRREVPDLRAFERQPPRVERPAEREGHDGAPVPRRLDHDGLVAGQRERRCWQSRAAAAEFNPLDPPRHAPTAVEPSSRRLQQANAVEVLAADGAWHTTTALRDTGNEHLTCVDEQYAISLGLYDPNAAARLPTAPAGSTTLRGIVPGAEARANACARAVGT